MMYIRMLKIACALALCWPALATAQQRPAQDTERHRAGSWELSASGGFQLLDTSLRDFLTSGAPEYRFANAVTASRGLPSATARLGYNFTRVFGISASVGGAMGTGMTYLNPAAAFTFTGNVDASTNPFLLIGTGFTRIDGQNGRTTHSTWGADVGAGIRQMLSRNLALRLEGRMGFAHYNEVPMSKHATYSPLVQLGLSYFVGGGTNPQLVTYAAPSAPSPGRVDTVRSMLVDTLRLTSPGLSSDQVILRVQFQTDRAELLPISGPVLDTVAAAIKTTPNSRWQVEGHTDNIGTVEYNRVLSQARAQSVVDYLVSHGVDRGILTAQGYGFDRPVFSNSTVEGRAQNRRVQLRRIPPPPTVPVP